MGHFTVLSPLLDDLLGRVSPKLVCLLSALNVWGCLVGSDPHAASRTEAHAGPQRRFPCIAKTPHGRCGPSCALRSPCHLVFFQNGHRFGVIEAVLAQYARRVLINGGSPTASRPAVRFEWICILAHRRQRAAWNRVKRFLVERASTEPRSTRGETTDG